MDLAIALYVSSVEGHVVFRPGTRTLIGAEFDLSAPGNVRYSTEKIVAIPEAEYVEHRRDYDRFLADGALVKRPAPKAASKAAVKAEDPNGSR